MRRSKTQISLGIRPVWSESSLSAWRKPGSLATHWANSEDSDQTGRMPSLIWVFAGRTWHLLVLWWGGSYYLLITICFQGKHVHKENNKHKRTYWPFHPYIKHLYTVKRSRRFYGKHWQLATSTCTVNFTGACRLFTAIITHGRVVKSKVSNVQDIIGMWATASCLKLTHTYPLLRGNSCESSAGPRKNLR